MTGPEQHLANAAALWRSIADRHGRVLLDGPELAAIQPAPGHALRVLSLRRPLDPAAVTDRILALVGEHRPAKATVEDAYGTLDLSECGFKPLAPMAVMARPAGAPPAERTHGLQIERVTDEAAVTVADRVIGDGFPRDRPWFPGQTLPSGLVDQRGWRIWLASRANEPAGAVAAYDDGETVGVYFLATLPAHRGRGVGGALMRVILTEFAGRPVNLTATTAGEPIYARLGFGTVAWSTWWKLG